MSPRSSLLATSNALAAIVEEVKKQLTPLFPPTVGLRVHHAPDVPDVVGNTAELCTLVANLAWHSKDALVSSSSTITIETRTLPSGAACLEIRHRAPLRISHSSADTHTDLMELASRSDAHLATARKIAVELGARTVAVSEAMIGTVFLVEFPARQPTAERKRAESHRRADPKAGHRVLYVEDEATLAAGYARLLSRLGCAVDLFFEPQAALTSFTNAPLGYDFVLTDNLMPGMSGADLAERIYAVRPGIPIVLLSGDLDEVRPSPALFARLTKPCSVDDLEKRLTRLPRA